MKKRVFALLLPVFVFCMLFSVNGLTAKATTNTTEPVAPTVSLSKKKISLHTKNKKTMKLKATVTGTASKVKWTTSNKKIAIVSQKGKVTAKKAGTATITATVDGVKATCKVTVKAPAPGRKGTYEKDFGGSVREVVIERITATEIKFQIRFTSMRFIAASNAITAKVNGNKAKFEYEDLGWGGKGTGTLTLSKNYVKIKTKTTSGEDHIGTGGKTFKLKRKNSKTNFIFY